MAPNSVCGNVPGECNSCWPVCDGSMCQGTNTCVSDADCNASPDDRCVCDPNGCTLCVLGVSKFAGLLDEGIWLIGWGGGLDHFSWVRFNFQTPTQGTFDLLDLVGPAYTRYFFCEGLGMFTADPPASKVMLQMPMGCDMGGMPQTETLTFESFYTSGFPPQANLGASVVTQNMQYLNGFRYPSSICNAGFTMCADPFQ